MSQILNNAKWKSAKQLKREAIRERESRPLTDEERQRARESCEYHYRNNYDPFVRDQAKQRLDELDAEEEQKEREEEVREFVEEVGENLVNGAAEEAFADEEAGAGIVEAIKEAAWNAVFGE